VICPDANIKFFVTAEAAIRTERRAKELYGDKWRDYFDDLLEQTNERDKRDSERATAPLKPAADAVMVDTSFMDADAVFHAALGDIRAKQAN
jgi:cytidylate kinase